MAEGFLAVTNGVMGLTAIIDGGGPAVTGTFGTVIFLAFVTPSILVLFSNVKDKGAVIAINLFLGWIPIVWFILLGFVVVKTMMTANKQT